MSRDDEYAADGEPAEECGPCMRGGGLLLLTVGLGLAYMGADLVTGGALTRVIAGGLGIGAAAPAAAPASDNDDQEVAADADDTAG